ncbi:hypothetical protein MXD86_12595, partial [Staphylococcus aureus]
MRRYKRNLFLGNKHVLKNISLSIPVR